MMMILDFFDFKESLSMNLFEAIEQLKNGKRIRCKSWSNQNLWWSLDDIDFNYTLYKDTRISLEEILFSDQNEWMVVEREPWETDENNMDAKITFEQLKNQRNYKA
jgi:hypothetical protein